jgi:hypothetical protein
VRKITHKGEKNYAGHLAAKVRDFIQSFLTYGGAVLSENTELIKASAAIQMENELTELQRLMVNVLLYHAYNELPDLTIEKHRIPIPYLKEAIGYQSNSLSYLKNLIKDIQSKPLEFNLLRKDKTQKWGSYALLAEAEIEDGYCYYAFGPTLRKLFYNPKVYARINLSIQSKLKHKHATPLFEICVDYLNESKRYGETPWIRLPVFRKLMGVSDDITFKILNRDVIKSAVERIEKKTDFRIAVERQKQGRSVAALKFRIRQELSLPDESARQSTLFPDNSMPGIVKALIDAGLSESDAGSIWQKQFDCVDSSQRKEIPANKSFDHYIHEKIDLLRHQDKSKLTSPTGFLITAIRKNYSNPDFAVREKAKHELQIATAKKQQRERLEQEQAKIGMAYSDACDGVCAAILRETPEVLATLIDTAVREAPILRQRRKGGTPEEQYRNSPFIEAAVNGLIKRRYPERFQAVNDEYQPRLEVLDAQIKVLG